MVFKVIAIPDDKYLQVQVDLFESQHKKALNIFSQVFENSPYRDKCPYPVDVRYLLFTYLSRQSRGEDTNALLGQLKELLQALGDGTGASVIQRQFQQYLQAL